MTLFVFLILLTLLMLLVAYRIVRNSRQPQAGAKSAAVPIRQGRLAQAQRKGLDTPPHLNDKAFAKLLRMAKGDRSKVEEWILAEQRMMPQLNRDSAIERIVLRLNQLNHN